MTTSTTLSNADKLNIINQHLKGIDFSVYGLQLDLLIENAATEPSEDVLDSINARLTSLFSKRSVLLEEAAPLSE
jgi:F0F1-type ATP synthase delta subunit